MFRRIAILLSAAALIAALPVLAQDNSEKDHGMEGDQCPYRVGFKTSMGNAMKLLDEAMAAKTTDDMSAKVAEARKELVKALENMAKCPEMSGEMNHGEHHGSMGSMDHDAEHGEMAAKMDKATDPVCGMKIEPSSAAVTSAYKGKTYYFCSQEDKAKFDKDPETYLKKKAG